MFVNNTTIKHALQSEEDLGTFLKDFKRWKEDTHRALGGDGYLVVDVSGLSCATCKIAVLRERNRVSCFPNLWSESEGCLLNDANHFLDRPLQNGQSGRPKIS